MAEKTLEMLQEEHADMLAQAVDLGVEVPQDLVPEFSTREVGEATCKSLDKLLAEFRKGLDDGEVVEAKEETTKKAPKRKRSGGKKAASTATDGETVTEKETEVSTATAKKAKAAPKAAKKASSKKSASKKKASSAARSGNVKKLSVADIKLGEDSKVTVVIKDPPVLKKDTKWAARLKKVYAHAGKKVSEFKGAKSDIKWAILRGFVKV